MNKAPFAVAFCLLLAALPAVGHPGPSRPEAPIPASCKLCRAFQEKIVELTRGNLDQLISIAREICVLGGSGALCSYMVDNFARELAEHKFNFLLKTNYLCNKMLDTCPTDFKAFNFTEYKEKIDREFPKATSGASDFPRRHQAQFRVLVLNDIHLQNDYLEGSEARCGDPGGCCAAIHGMPTDPARQAGYWGTPDAKCDMPEHFYTATLKWIAAQPEKPDFIVLLGDNVAHHYFRMPAEVVSNATATVLNDLKRILPDIPVIPVLGNHECHPVEYLNFTQYDNWVFKNIVDQFGLFIPRGKVNQFKEKGLFTLEFPDQNVKFISINSQVLDGFNAAITDVTGYPWRFLHHLASELAESEKAGQKAIVLNHIEITDYFAIRELNQALLYILERFQDTVVSYLSGHTHADQIRFMRGQDRKVFAANYVSPSITTASCYNPSYRVYEYADGKLADFKQYYFDIDEGNAKARRGDFTFEFKLGYSFLQRYGLKDTGKEELARLYQRLLSKTDPVIEQYVASYYCKTKYPGWEHKREEVTCELHDDIEQIYRCLWKESRNGIFINLPPLIYQKLFVGPTRIPKEGFPVTPTAWAAADPAADNV